MNHTPTHPFPTDTLYILTRAELLSFIHSVDRASRLIADMSKEHGIPRWQYEEDLRYEELQNIKKSCLTTLHQDSVFDSDPTPPAAA